MNLDKVRNEIIEKLKERGAEESFYLDIVDDYMVLYELKSYLKEDIKIRGVSIMARGKNGVIEQMINPSMAEFTKTSKSMVKMLKDLGLSATELEVIEEHEEL